MRTVVYKLQISRILACSSDEKGVEGRARVFRPSGTDDRERVFGGSAEGRLKHDQRLKHFDNEVLLRSAQHLQLKYVTHAASWPLIEHELACVRERGESLGMSDTS
jgi:hypothetical protein